MALLNYTTGIDADKSAAEISKALRRIGAQSVLTDYDPTGEYITALSFRLNLNGQDVSFRLPCDPAPVLQVLTEQKQRNPRIKATQEQAVRTAWRILKDWVEAQAAIIETRMVSTLQVFLPYALVSQDQTLFEKVMVNPTMLLGDGS